MQLVPVVPVDVAEADREGRRGEADVFGVEHVRAGVAVEVLIAADGLIGLGLDRRDGVGAGLERGVELLVVGVEIGHHDAVGLRPLVELVVGGIGHGKLSLRLVVSEVSAGFMIFSYGESTSNHL